MDSGSPTEERKPDSFVRASASAIRRKRVIFNKEQLRILIDHFQRNPYPGIEEREELSGKITIDESRIQVWFQNRRARQLATQKKQASLASTNSKKWTHPKKSSPSQILKEDIHKHDLSKQEFSLPNATPSDSWSEPGKPHQEAGPRSCSKEGRSVASTTEAACSEYNISQDHDFVSSQTMRSSTELQLCALPRPVSQGSSSQCESSWTLKETQGPENHAMHTFYGEVKPPSHCQQQGRTTGQLSLHYNPLTFQCAQEPSCQLQQPYSQKSRPQKPPALLPLVLQTPTFQVQQLASSLHQSPQGHQNQTQPPALMRGEEQPNELFPSSNQQEQLKPINLYKRTVGLGSTVLLPDRHLPAHSGDLDTTLRDLDNILRGLTSPQRYLTAEIADVVYKQINDLLAALND